jgi:hypothetical protein
VINSKFFRRYCSENAHSAPQVFCDFGRVCTAFRAHRRMGQAFILDRKVCAHKSGAHLTPLRPKAVVECGVK